MKERRARRKYFSLDKIWDEKNQRIFKKDKQGRRFLSLSLSFYFYKKNYSSLSSKKCIKPLTQRDEERLTRQGQERRQETNWQKLRDEENKS